MRKLELKRFEIVLIIGSVFLFGAAFVLYVADIPVRNFLPGISREELRNQIGVVASKQGTVRRESSGETEFKAIEQNAAVFNEDTIVTSAEGAATLELAEGGTVELGPASMVKMAFESRWSLGGITRHASVDVVSGQVTGRAEKRDLVIRSAGRTVSIPKNTAQVVKPKPVVLPLYTPTPKPSLIAAAKVTPVAVPTIAPPPPPPSPPPPPPPEPSLITWVSPVSGTRFHVEKDSPKAEISVGFQWQVTPADRQFTLVIRKAEESDPVLKQVISPAQGVARYAWTGREPGEYSWELVPADNKPLAKPVTGRLSLDPEFEAIRIVDPLVSGEKRVSNLMSGKQYRADAVDFAITLKWQPYAGAEGYRLAVGTSSDLKKAVVNRKMSSTEYLLNKGRVFTGRIYYKVSAILPSGFVATSPVARFSFEFLPPILTRPADKASVALEKGKGAETGVLFAWQKTHFTQRYEIQVSRDEKFTSLLINKVKNENFHFLNSPAPGRYWWRVRSIAKDLSSQFSKPQEFTVLGRQQGRSHTESQALK